MTPRTQAPPPTTSRELIHAVNNFLSLVMTTGQAALDKKMSYDPERALHSILDGADRLNAYVKSSRDELVRS